mmetsp:Transcript_81951/g.171496  ORF Transcript_81951/g.171496 Transcript_81951/m.171496 type:complete len:234 (+) Transcript_81951:371-1072(+)
MRLQVAEVVVGVPMGALVGPDALEDVPEHGVLGEVVVHSGHSGRGQVREHGQSSTVDLLEQGGVGVHGLFLQVAHEAVAEAGADQIHDRVPSQENSLATNHQASEDRARLPQSESDQQVHALVLGLREQGMDPAVVAAHEAQGVQMSAHAGHHAWDASDGLKEDHSSQPISLSHVAGGDSDLVEGGQVKPCSQGLHTIVCSTIDPVLRVAMGFLDAVQVFPGVGRLCEQVRFL